MIILFSVLLFASDTAPSVEAEKVAPAAVEAPKEKARQERKICKLEENTMSRTAAKRVCLTAAEWRARGAPGALVTERAERPGYSRARSNTSSSWAIEVSIRSS